MSPQAYPTWCTTIIQKEQILTCSLYTRLEDRTRQTIDILQLCDCSVQHHSDRSIRESVEIQQQRFGDTKKSIRSETASHRCCMRAWFYRNTRRPSAATNGLRTRRPVARKPHGETLCVMTLNKFKALSSTSESNQNQNSRQTTRTRKRHH